MALVKNGEIADDPWTHVEAEGDLPGGTELVVSLDQWKENKVDLCKRGGALGIRLASDQPPELIADDLNHFTLIELEFPAFTDGRAYSYARLLRERHGYEGELRAVGDVLLEQLHFMHRSGFDAFEVDSETAAEDWAIACKDIDVWYQPTSDGRQTVVQRRWSS